MKFLYISSFCLLFYVMASCSNKQVTFYHSEDEILEGCTVINISDIKDSSVIACSDIFSEVEYIPLEDTFNSTVGMIEKLAVVEFLRVPHNIKKLPDHPRKMRRLLYRPEYCTGIDPVQKIIHTLDVAALPIHLLQNPVNIHEQIFPFADGSQITVRRMGIILRNDRDLTPCKPIISLSQCKRSLS